jgi:hypothetical protein
MNEPLKPPLIPQTLAASDAPTPNVGLPQWAIKCLVKRFLACNPFYLVSAALLLYGFYRVSVDANFLRGELAQLWFNFGSLQCYEILLVLTAVLLARRRIWYDSTLLVGLENLLVLVPFILLSEAALTGQGMAWGMCLGAGVVAVARFGGLRRGIPELNFPRRLAAIGLVVLAANVALLVAYRILQRTKYGVKMDFGVPYQTNQYIWWLLLPALVALANLLPRLRPTGKLPPQSPWLPLSLFSLWLTGTVVHLYCLSYVYEFSLRVDMVVPTVWVLVWTFQLRGAARVERLGREGREALLAAPLVATLPAALQPGDGNGVFLVLTVLNLAIYSGIRFYHRDHRLALHLVFMSLAALIAGFPGDWGRSLLAGFDRAACLGAAMAAFCLLCAASSRNPKLGLLGALAAAVMAAALAGQNTLGLHWAVQTAAAFLLLHSLRWVDTEHVGASTLRIIGGLVWAVEALVWSQTSGAAWMTAAVAGPVIAFCLLSRWLTGRWGSPVVPAAAVLAMLSGPTVSAAGSIPSVPVGLMAVIGSFLLLGLGTLMALTKHHWNRTD